MFSIKEIHKFTEEERRVVQEAQQRYLHTVEVIAHIHGLYQPCIPLPDGTGIGMAVQEAYSTDGR